VGEAGDPQPVRSEHLWRLLDLYRESPPVILPVRVDYPLAWRARHVLLLESAHKVLQAVGPASQEIDPMKFSDAEELLERLKAERDDETWVFQLLQQVRGNTNFFLDADFVEGGVATAKEHLRCLVLQRVGDLPAPTVSRLDGEDVRKY